MKSQILTMLDLQNGMNCKVNPDWRKKGFEWYRAIWVEAAELMDHYGWKWWKKQEPDMEQVKLEIIDIWHFGMSHLMLNESDEDKLADEIVASMGQSFEPQPFRDALETFTEATLVSRGFDTQSFGQLMAAAELGFDELYVGYIGKNVLNFFRQDHGYQDGSYIKEWGGREDNEHLVEICTMLDPHADGFKDKLYEGLSQRYKDLA